MFLQVKRRTSERDEAAGRGYERWWFPPFSHPCRAARPATASRCHGLPGDNWRLAGIVTRGEH